MAKNVENLNPLIVFNDTDSLTYALPCHRASKAGTKVGPLVQVNLDESKILNKVFLKAYFTSKLIQSDIKFSDRWTSRRVVYLVPGLHMPSPLSCYHIRHVLVRLP